MNPDPLFHEQLEDLRSEFGRDLRAVEGLAALQPVRRELDRLVEDLDQQLHRARRAAVVVLVGPTGAGKSTLLNALVGREIATEGELRPTTSRPTVHAPEDADLTDLLAGFEGPLPHVVRYGPTAEGPFAGQVLIDAPDTNSAAREHRATVRALAERADVLLVLLKAESVVEESTLAFLDEFRGRRELIVVLGRADELDQASREQVLAQLLAVVRTRLGEGFGAPVALSATDARAGRGGAPFTALVSQIEHLADSSRLLGVKRHNALGAAARIGALIAERGAGARGALLALAPDLERGLAELAARTSAEVDTRLRLRAPELAERVGSESGRRWNGPVGWTLRLGASSTVGLGAAALVARRNPLLAAGAALAGTAISRVRDVVVDRRLEDIASLLPEAGEFDSWWVETLSDVRLAAGRLERAGDDAPAALSVPTAPALLAAFERPVADTWQRLLARDLPEAAARASRWPSKMLFDLAPYALLVWMVWRAAEGFFRGPYAGLDYFLNGFFLLAALLLILRLLLGRWHTSIGNRLAKTAATRATVTLVYAATAAAVPLAEAAGTRAAALARLGQLDARWRASLFERR